MNVLSENESENRARCRRGGRKCAGYLVQYDSKSKTRERNSRRVQYAQLERTGRAARRKFGKRAGHTARASARRHQVLPPNEKKREKEEARGGAGPEGKVSLLLHYKFTLLERSGRQLASDAVPSSNEARLLFVCFCFYTRSVRHAYSQQTTSLCFIRPGALTIAFRAMIPNETTPPHFPPDGTCSP